MYTSQNFRTKKALREAIAAGHRVTVFQPNALVQPPTNGRVAVEGPHSPEPHRWYANVEIKDSVVVKVLS